MKFPPMYNFNPLDVRDLDLWFSEGDFDIIIMRISFPNDHKWHHYCNVALFRMAGHAWVPLEPLDWPNCVSLHPPHHPNCPHRCTVALSFWVFMIIENTNMKSHHPDCTHRWCCHFIDISGKWNIENPEFSRTEINIPWNGPKDVQKKLLPGYNLEIIIFCLRKCLQCGCCCSRAVLQHLQAFQQKSG